MAQISLREGALIASGTGGPQTASLNVLRLADDGIRSEAAHCFARISEAVVSVMDGNGHRCADGGAIVVASTLARGTYCSSWRGSLLGSY